MDLKEVKTRLNTLNIPSAYRQFKRAVKLPFVVYYEGSGELWGADDGGNKIRRVSVIIEFYSEIKDTEIESKIETLFNDVELDKDEVTTDDNMLMVIYNFEFTEVI